MFATKPSAIKYQFITSNSNLHIQAIILIGLQKDLGEKKGGCYWVHGHLCYCGIFIFIDKHYFLNGLQRIIV